MNTKIFQFNAKEITTNGRKFTVYSAKIKDNYYKIKFTKDCNGIPTEHGIYEIKVNVDQMSVQKGKDITTTKGNTIRENDTLWINGYESIRKCTKDDFKEVNRIAVESIFD